MAGDDNMNTEGRKENAAKPLNTAQDNAGAERYPPTGRDDSVGKAGDGGEARSFDPSVDAPTPRQGAGDGSQTSQDLTGPGGDPAEGKR